MSVGSPESVPRSFSFPFRRCSCCCLGASLLSLPAFFSSYLMSVPSSRGTAGKVSSVFWKLYHSSDTWLAFLNLTVAAQGNWHTSDGDVTSLAWSHAAGSWVVPVLPCGLWAAHFGTCNHTVPVGAPQLWDFHARFEGEHKWLVGVSGMPVAMTAARGS